MNLTKQPANAPAFASDIDSFREQLISYAALQGKQNGIYNKPKTTDEFIVHIFRTIETKTQGKIYQVSETYGPISGMATAHRIEKQAKEKIHDIQADINEAEHELQRLNQQKQHTADTEPSRSIHRIWEAIFAISESYFAYEALRGADFSRSTSLMCSIGIGAAIFLILPIAAAYIKKAGDPAQRSMRLLFVLLPAFVGFFILATLRAKSYDEESALTIDSYSTAVSQSNTSPAALAAISFLIFVAALAFAVKKSKPDENRAKEHRRASLGKELHAVKARMRKGEEDIAHIEAVVAEESAQALRAFEEALSMEARLQTIATEALLAYIESNLRHRRDNIVPAFFVNPPKFQFNLFFETIKNKQS